MGGSGGGGSSGKVEYPAYLQSRHETWLDAVYSDINVANPYTSKNAPSISALTSTSSANTDFKSYLDGRKTAIENWIASGSPTSSEMTALLSDLNAYLTELRGLSDLSGAVDLETITYPRFESGMRDINAVQSSAFVIGRAVMESNYAAGMVEKKYQLINEIVKMRGMLVSAIDTAKRGSTDQRLQLLAGLDPFYDSLYARVIDLGRLTVIAENEQAAMDADFDEKAGRWKLENWQTACNVMAAISGGTAVSTKGTNKGQSALAGGLSGAAAGAMIGAQLTAPMPLAGAAIGAAIGIGASFL